MKKFLLLIFCMAAMLTSYAQPPASYDFEAPDMHGNTLRYKITDATRNQVKMVQLKGTSMVLLTSPHRWKTVE